MKINGSSSVMVRLLSRGQPRPIAAQRLNWIERQCPEWDVDWHFNKYCVATARCEVVKEARQAHVEFLIMLDDDVDSGPHVAQLPALNLPVVSGAVLTFQGGCLFWNAYGLTPGGIFYSFPAVPDQVIEAYAVGTAVICIRREVLEDRRLDPLFEFTVNADGTGTPLGGEDITFCRKLQRQGTPLYVDGRIQAEHQTVCDTLTWLYQTRRAGREQCVPSTMVINTRKIGVDCPAAAYHARRQDRETEQEQEALTAFEEAAFAV